MSTPLPQLLWFKRDLRLHEHAALAAAAARGPVLGLVVFEPSLAALPDASGRQAAFQVDCLRPLQAEAARSGLPLLAARGEMPDLLQGLFDALGPFTLHSHEETGNWASFQRDRRVAGWCRARGVEWLERPQNNVVRALASRDQWGRIWDARMSVPLTPVPHLSGLPAPLQDAVGRLPDAFAHADLEPWLALARTDTCPGRQAGGRREALALLQGFLDGRGLNYRRHMSSPGTSEHSCSRLSPHLAWGSLSVRETVQAVWRARTRWLGEAGNPDQRAMLASLKSFESRLHWRCHFMQKLESEPEMEFRCLHPATRGVRNEGPLDAREMRVLQAWREGRTGLPFVDACMRFLQHHGWINFRMRAMLVSFASQHLWLHWRETGEHLARLFTDYEPGIHWPQVQMQSGTTGINTIRIYNPEKQRQDQDPSGEFVARWVPELASGAYPAPIVDHLAAAREARERLWGLRGSSESRDHARQIYEKHGSRNPAREGTPRRPRAARGKGSAAPEAGISPQQELDFS